MTNCSIDYDRAAAMIRQIVCLQPAHGGRSARTDALLDSEVPRLLTEVERQLATALQASGVAEDVAAYSALLFVALCAQQYRAGGRAEQ